MKIVSRGLWARCAAVAALTLLTLVCGAASAVAALPASGMVVGWGDDTFGQTSVPAGLNHVVAIATGVQHSLALKDDGTVVAWGYNSDGQANVPTGLNHVVAIAAGLAHSLALKDDGTVVAWGSDWNGQSSVPPGLNHVVAIAAGIAHSLALKDDGTVVAWGQDDFGQTDVPAGLGHVTAIAAGTSSSLALKDDGTVVAWGWNGGGQSDVPAGLSHVTAIAGGDVHSLALKDDGTVVAWGADYYGQTDVPPGLSSVIAVAAGWEHSLALKDDGTVVAWGLDRSGQTNVPTGLTGVTAISAGSWYSLALVEGTGPDSMAPILAVPKTISTDASIAAGAEVTYTVTATDNADPNPTVRCDPSSGSTFPIGDTTVNCTATDASGNTATESFVVHVLGPAEMKQGVLSLATALLVKGNAADVSKLEVVIDKLTVSLDQSRWIDQSHLASGPQGRVVFDREEAAVVKLMALVRTGSTPTVVTVSQGMIDRLVQADEILAKTALNDATVANGWPNLIADGQTQLKRAANQDAQGAFDNAVDHYRIAWQKAQASLR